MKRKSNAEKKVFLNLSFAGTNFRGFQYQNKGRTVQREIENALKKIDFQPKIIGCSRTDGGVHARNFIAHFIDKNPQRKIKDIVNGLNSNLPQDILVKSAGRVDENFHARFSTTSKTYRYFIFLGNSIPPPVEPFAVKHYFDFNIRKAAEALPLFVGRKNFWAFTTSEGRKVNTEREISSISLLFQNPLLCFDIEGKSFLHRMVRFIVGAIVAYSREKIDTDFLKASLEGNVDFLPFPAMAAKGLHLWDLQTEEYEIFEKYEDICPLPLWPFENIKFDEVYRVSL